MKNIIFGTDWWTDCDDAVALRLVCNNVKEGKVNLLGVGINACMEYSVASLKGFLEADGLTGIPVGIDFDGTDFGGNPPYQKRLAQTYGKGAVNSDAENAVRLYRRILAGAEEKIEIIEVGFLQVIAAVLKSGADDISEKSGYELVRDKVSKIWVMAGKWDGDGEQEHNFCNNVRSRVAGHEFCELCPVPVTFLGWEIGYGVITGAELDKSDFLYQVLVDHGSEHGRHSWDPMLTLMALIGDETEAGYKTVSGFASVDADTGANHFSESPDGLHKYVIKLYGNEYYKEQINKRL
jgi:hypothetical protein